MGNYDNLFLLSDSRIICSVGKLLPLFKDKCHHGLCTARYKLRIQFVGCCQLVNGVCESGHKFEWQSSDCHVNEKHVKLYENNLRLVSAIVVSGNSFNKIDLLFKFLSLATASRTTFYNYQRHYICPAVDKFYRKEQVSMYNYQNATISIYCRKS